MKAPTITVCLLFTFLLIPNQYLKAQGDDFESDPILMLKEFYTRYISICSTGKAGDLASIREKFCTRDLLNEIYGKQAELLDYDPFLNAQDCDIKSLKTLEVKRDDKDQNIFIVTYVWPSDNKTISIKTGVIKVRDTYKISKLFIGEISTL